MKRNAKRTLRRGMKGGTYISEFDPIQPNDKMKPGDLNLFPQLPTEMQQSIETPPPEWLINKNNPFKTPPPPTTNNNQYPLIKKDFLNQKKVPNEEVPNWLNTWGVNIVGQKQPHTLISPTSEKSQVSERNSLFNIQDEIDYIINNIIYDINNYIHNFQNIYKIDTKFLNRIKNEFKKCINKSNPLMKLKNINNEISKKLKNMYLQSKYYLLQRKSYHHMRKFLTEIQIKILNIIEKNKSGFFFRFVDPTKII